MRLINVYVRNGLVGCDRRDQIEIEEGMSDDDIDETVKDWMFEQIEWGWSPADSDKDKE